jgi:outer membrane receptor protein involved in Fe transport
MKLSNVPEWLGSPAIAVLALLALLAPTAPSSAQGVTTGTISGMVLNMEMPVSGAAIIAIHLPSGTTYEARSRNDGRFFIPGVRVGGPYSVTATFEGGAGTAFQPETKDDVTVNLGVSSDLRFDVRSIAVQETVTVSATVDPVFSSSHTGAATTVGRAEISTLPTLSGRISDVTRLTPQSSGENFAGTDNRMTNITVDGSSFNSSFGLAGQPGGRTGVAPISLEAIEQIQVSIAPYDVRQGAFIGAGVNTVTRSGGNRLSGSFYHRFRDQDWVGSEAKGQTFQSSTFSFRNTGGWASGPILRNKWFAFGNYENELDKRPLSTWRANKGGEPITGNTTRVLASDLTTLSQFLKSNFDYDTGGFDDLPGETPAKRFLLRSDYNLSNSNKVSFRYNHLNSSTDRGMSNSTSALRGRNAGSSSFLSFDGTNYEIIENIRSGIGEWNWVVGNSIANSFQSGYTYQDESRVPHGSIFPFVEIYEGGTSYTAFGFEPFSYNNELRYKTFQIQDNLTKFTNNHSWTFGVYAEKYQSENIFFSCCPQSAYSYNSLADFYTDANGYLANRNRTTSPITLAQFQVRYSNIPGDDKAKQMLDVWYYAGYAQDEWRPGGNVTVTAGVRFDLAKFKNTAFQNPAADALTFRDETGAAVQFQTGVMPESKVLWSPRVGINWDVAGDQKTQVRGGTGVFTGKPAYVWVSNQIGNTGVLITERRDLAPGSAFPFNPDPDRYKLAATGLPSASYTLNVTDPDFKFPQVWRTNVAVDRKLPGGITSTTEYMYAKDINGIYYIDANLPAPQSAFTGVDTRPRWTSSRLNTTPGNLVNNAFVLKNGNDGKSWNFSQSLQRNFRAGLNVRGAWSYGESETLVDPESTAATTFARVVHHGDPNNAGPGTSLWSPGHRVFALVSYSKEYFRLGSTSVSLFWEARPSSSLITSSRLSYAFGTDMNGDGSTNDLIYIPRDQSEMNFSAFTVGTRTFTAAEQAAAYEAYIQQDPYLSKHRGQYAERYGLGFPMLRRADLSITQDLFRNLGGQRNGFQIRADILNFGNLLNSNWGVGQTTNLALNTNNQLTMLTNPTMDAAGRSTYRLALVNNELPTKTFKSSAFTSDVWQFMLSLRYSFN